MPHRMLSAAKGRLGVPSKDVEALLGFRNDLVSRAFLDQLSDQPLLQEELRSLLASAKTANESLPCGVR